MGTISNYRGFYQRKYIENGVLKTEETREIAQIFNSTANDITDNKYIVNSENAPTTNFTGFGSRSFNYTEYSPGLVYLPKKYYTFKDVFPDGWTDYFGGRTLEEFVASDYTVTANDPSLFQGFSHSYLNPNYVFWKDDVRGFQMVPKIEIIGHPRNGASFDRYASIRFSFLIIDSTYDLSKLRFTAPGTYNVNATYSSKVWCYLDTDDKYKEVQLNGRAGVGTGWSYPNYMLGMLDFYLNGGIYHSPEEIANLLKTRTFKMLNKVKFWFGIQRYSSYNFNNIQTYKTTDNISMGNNTYKYFTMFLDISDCPYFPTSGFFIKFGTQDSKLINAITLDWTEGPDETTPGERDDPNVDDPGYGPGGNPDDKGGDGNHDNTSDKIRPPEVPNISASGAGLITVFNPSVSQLAQLGSVLWSPSALEAIKQYFTNPMDTILGLGIVPVKPNTGVSREIYLGAYPSKVSAPVVDSDYVIVNCGSIVIDRYYGSYLDYSPYTKIKMFLPYIGEVDINPDEVMQTSLMVLYYVNVITGDIVALICANENILYTYAGNCIRQLPISSTDYSSIINTAVNAVGGIAMAVATAGAGNASIAAAGAAKGATAAGKELAESRATMNNVSSANNLLGDVMSAKFNYKHAGSIGTGSGQLGYQKPYLIIERPNLNLADNYKGFVGYPCNMTKQIGRCVGYTEIEASNLAVANATDAEVAEIKELLLQGVII